MIRDSAHVGGGRGVAEAGCVVPGHVSFSWGYCSDWQRQGCFFRFFRDVGIKIARVNMCVGWGELVLLLEGVVEIFGACPVRAGIHSGNVDWV